MIDEDKLNEFWSKNRQRFNGNFPLKDFLEWASEWDAICEKIRYYGEQQRRGKKK